MYRNLSSTDSASHMNPMEQIGSRILQIISCALNETWLRENRIFYRRAENSSYPQVFCGQTYIRVV